MPTPKPTTLEFNLPSVLTMTRVLLKNVENRLKENAFKEKEIFGIKLGLEEAIVNAIKHGNRLDPAKMVFTQITISTTQVEITVTDEGPGFNPDKIPDPQAPENLERPCGRGLLLMKNYMSEVIFHSPGNRVTMIKRRIG